MPASLQGAVLGHPIGHSKSPALHNAAYQSLGIDFSYRAIDVEIPALAELLTQVRAEGNWYGLSVTMPLKNAAVELVDELTPIARAPRRGQYHHRHNGRRRGHLPARR
ncbi:shikimate dehydrogenase family protein [Arthrobacter psychrolactophilus]